MGRIDLMLSKGLLSKALKAATRNAIPLGVGAGFLGAGVMSTASASDDCIPPPKQSWSHKGAFSSFDAASMRRGYEVYRQVCSTCHAMNFLCYRNLVGNTHTKEHAEMLAGSIEVKDGLMMKEKCSIALENFSIAFQHLTQMRKLLALQMVAHILLIFL